MAKLQWHHTELDIELERSRERLRQLQAERKRLNRQIANELLNIQEIRRELGK